MRTVNVLQFSICYNIIIYFTNSIFIT